MLATVVASEHSVCSNVRSGANHDHKHAQADSRGVPAERFCFGHSGIRTAYAWDTVDEKGRSHRTPTYKSPRRRDLKHTIRRLPLPTLYATVGACWQAGFTTSLPSPTEPRRRRRHTCKGAVYCTPATADVTTSGEKLVPDRQRTELTVLV